jgi:hypothetical protein
MWNLTVVADAKPVIVLVVARACFRSKKTEALPSTAAEERSSTPSSKILNVAAVDDALSTTILVTIVVVLDGTVYSVVLDVAAAVLARALDVVAISYYSLFFI